MAEMQLQVEKSVRPEDLEGLLQKTFERLRRLGVRVERGGILLPRSPIYVKMEFQWSDD